MAYDPADLRLPHWLLRLLDWAVRIRLPLAPSWRIGFTRPGVLYMGALLGVWVAAVYSANNLLYLCGAMMFALLIVGVGAAMRQLRGIPSVAAYMPATLYAGAAYALRETVDFTVPFAAVVDMTWCPGTSKQELLSEPVPLSMRCMQDKSLLTGSIQSHRRGVFPMHEQTLVTEAPLGMWRLSYTRGALWTQVVLPKQVPWRIGVKPDGDQHQALKEGDEWRDLRAYVPGDVLSRVHWRKADAMHAGGWLVKRFASGEAEAAEDTLRVDLRLPAGVTQMAFERLLGQASFWVSQRLATSAPPHCKLVLGQHAFDLGDAAQCKQGLKELAAAMPEPLPPAGNHGMLLSLVERQ
ncbi:MAG: DUF58 domain-containing protein [Mariprofundaceae bacterium]